MNVLQLQCGSTPLYWLVTSCNRAETGSHEIDGIVSIKSLTATDHGGKVGATILTACQPGGVSIYGSSRRHHLPCSTFICSGSSSQTFPEPQKVQQHSASVAARVPSGSSSPGKRETRPVKHMLSDQLTPLRRVHSQASPSTRSPARKLYKSKGTIHCK